MFTFSPLQGAQSESTASQSLLELDGGVKVLIDVGWDESFDPEKLRELEKQIPTISLVLLTHATISHIGAFAHCCKHFPRFARIPVFATKPVIDLGRTLLQDLYASTPRAASTIPRSALAEASFSYAQSRSAEHTPFLLQAPTADEIARYFGLIHELKYSQPHQPQQVSPTLPPLHGLTITAYNAGRTLGGTLWHIQLGLESVVYAVDWGQYKENVFSGAAWIAGGGSGTAVIEQLRKPTALVSSSRCPPVARPGLRDEQLLGAIRRCVARGGTVLLPVDSTARILELAYVLEHAWRRDAAAAADKVPDAGALSSAKLYLAGRTSGSLMRHARTLLEWMNESIVQEFEAVADGSKQAGNNGRGGNSSRDDTKREAGPFDLRHIRLLERKAQVERVLENTTSAPASSGRSRNRRGRRDNNNTNGPGRVILASDSSLEWGFSREVLRAIASDHRNLVVLTEVPGALDNGKTSLARTLWEWWREGQQQQQQQQASRKQQEQDNEPLVVGGDGRVLAVQDARKEALDDAELALYQQWLATQRQRQATLVQTRGGGGAAVAALEGGAGGGGDGTGGPGRVGAGLDDDDDASSSSSSSGSDADSDADHEGADDGQGKVLNVATTLGQVSRRKVVLRDEDLGVTILLKRRGHYDYDVRGKKGRERLFPVAVRRKRTDVFGELIRPDEYLRAEEREEEAEKEKEVAAATAQASPDDGGLGKKRKWDDVGRTGTGTATGTASRRRRGEESEKPEQRDGERGDRDSDADDDDNDDNDDDDDEEVSVATAGPSKLAFEMSTLSLHAHIAYIDYSGLHTARNLEMLLPLVEPRKLVLVGGSAAETAAVAAQYRTVVGTMRGVAPADVDVLAPAAGSGPVDASVDTHAWVVRLADALVKTLHWQTLRGLGVVTLRGEVRAAEEAAAASEGESLPTLDVVTTTTVKARAPLHVGELRLADLRRAMQAAGHTAEFRGEGTLVVDGTVAVRKTSAGRVEVESIGQAAAEGRGTFYAVRQMIYQGLAVVAG